MVNLSSPFLTVDVVVAAIAADPAPDIPAGGTGGSGGESGGVLNSLVADVLFSDSAPENLPDLKVVFLSVDDLGLGVPVGVDLFLSNLPDVLSNVLDAF